MYSLLSLEPSARNFLSASYIEEISLKVSTSYQASDTKSTIDVYIHCLPCIFSRNAEESVYLWGRAQGPTRTVLMPSHQRLNARVGSLICNFPSYDLRHKIGPYY